MKLTNEQLQQVTDFAELLFTPAEVATIIGVPVLDFQIEQEKPESEVSAAFQRGRLLAKATIRKKLFTLAQQGSSQAQSLVLKLEQESESQMLRDEYEH